MLPHNQKKIVLDKPVLGFAILQAAQLAIRVDKVAEFRSMLFNTGYTVRKLLPKKSLDLRVEACGDVPIDTRLMYHDFVISGFVQHIRGVKNAPVMSDAIVSEIEKFSNELLMAIEVLRWVRVPRLEREICGWCSDDVGLKWDDDIKEWECPNHGFIASEFIEMQMIRPFLP